MRYIMRYIHVTYLLTYLLVKGFEKTSDIFLVDVGLN